MMSSPNLEFRSPETSEDEDIEMGISLQGESARSFNPEALPRDNSFFDTVNQISAPETLHDFYEQIRARELDSAVKIPRLTQFLFYIIYAIQITCSVAILILASKYNFACDVDEEGQCGSVVLSQIINLIGIALAILFALFIHNDSYNSYKFASAITTTILFVLHILAASDLLGQTKTDDSNVIGTISSLLSATTVLSFFHALILVLICPSRDTFIYNYFFTEHNFSIARFISEKFDVRIKIGRGKKRKTRK